MKKAFVFIIQKNIIISLMNVNNIPIKIFFHFNNLYKTWMFNIKMEKENFTWHKVSEQEKEEIKKQAKNLLDNFASKIEKIKIKEDYFENETGLRDEGSTWNTDSEFQNALFCNAPFVEDGFLVAEKGEWKK